MEIDCSEKFGGNEKNAAKELNIDDKSGMERELADNKEHKVMVANIVEGAATKTADPTAATAGADTESGTDGGGGCSGSGGRPATTEFAQKVIDSQDCDKTPEKCMETKSQTDLSSSPGQDDKEDAPEMLAPMAEFVEQDGQVVEETEVEEEEEECEKSSLVKGCDEELISDTEEYNEEQDAADVTEIIEDDDDEDENDTSSVPSELENMNRSKGTSDAEDDSDEDEYNEDDDDDVELVPDSSDEEGSEDSRDVSSKNLDIPLSDDDDDDDENYDDDDLMNDVIMASKKSEAPVNRRKEESRSTITRLKNTGDFKKKLRWDYRTQLKKRSVRWLIKRLHKEPGVHYACRSELVKASPAQIKSNHDIEVISIDLDDSPEKSQPASSLLSHQFKESSVKPPVFEMQQVDKIRDSIQSAEDLKQQQQQQVKSLKDEQNKENVENNDKLLNNSLKLNGNVSNAKTEDKTKGDGEKSESHKDMDVSVEDGDEKSSEQTIVEIADVEKIEKDIDEDNRDEQVKADDTNQEKAAKSDKNRNEAVSNEVSEFQRTATAEEKSICKESVATDLKIPPRTSKRSRSASLENSPKLEDIHPTKKLRAELESNFPTHDRILSEYIEKTSNNSVDEIQKHMNQLIIEIQTLNDMIKAKEIEWNNMLHLKKVKEEICFRLSRKKQVMEIMSTKAGEATIVGGEDTLNDTILQNPISKPLKLVASTPNTSAVAPNLSASGIAATSNVSSGNAGTTAQSILQNRANMKSSDLAKEKANTQRLHRNILPKPSSTSSTAVAGFGASTQVSIPSISSMLASSQSATTAVAAAAATSSATGLMNIPLSMASGSLGGVAASNGALGTQQPILNSYLTAAATVQQQLGEMLNGHHNPALLQPGNTNGGQTLMVGRQGVFKDVKSIIADYRQRHPEAVPRRGRRVKSNPSATDSSSILSNVLKNDGKLAGLDLGAVLTKFDGNSRPSSNDSSHSMTNLIGTNSNSANLGNVSFKDVLVQFAKMSGQTERMGTVTSNKLPGSTATGSGSQSAPPPYPEVTLHPVSTTQSNADQTGSLLHGILTKYTRPNASTVTSTAPTSTSQTTVSQSFSSSFSPTLARLLTAPERITTAQNSQTNSVNSFQANLQAVQSAVAGSGLNLSKVVGHNSEITITPVLSGQPLQQTLVQQQFQHQQQQQQLKEIRDRVKAENILNLDAEADDSVDRLVIDEGGDSAGMDGHHRIAPHAIGQEFHENEVPACQGCKKQEAQFVCAGCGNQWYCSRDCQVAAWDEHSEVCTG